MIYHYCKVVSLKNASAKDEKKEHRYFFALTISYKMALHMLIGLEK